MSWDLAVFALFVVVAFIIILVHNWNVALHGTPIERWAKANGFALISEECEVFRSSRILGVHQTLPQTYRIVVRDREGKTRTGRLAWTGRPLDKMQVRWDETT